MDEIIQYFSEKSIEDREESLRFGGRLDPVNRIGNVDDFAGHVVQNISYDAYGDTVNDLGAKNGGAYKVTMDPGSSSSVTGKYFVALQGNPTATLSFVQDGATITFLGSEVVSAASHELFALTYYKGAFQEEGMKSAASGIEGFSYGFAGHGNLPGMATFEIETDLSPGTSVNVYLFDGETGQFSLIAGNVTVAAKGIVTYKNNTLSEYVITTQPIPGALISDMSEMQETQDGKPFLIIVAAVCVLLLGLSLVLWIQWKKRKQRR
jgi:hypothetical protein